jgi:hypothetical protein
LSIDGLEKASSRVNKIDAFVIKQEMLSGGGTNSGTGDCSQTASMILNSDEYRTKLIGDLYQQFLHRPADPPGINMNLSLLKSGGSTEGILIGLLRSPEYFTAQGGGSNSGFVGKLYQDLLNRAADPSATQFINALDNNSKTRQQIAMSFIQSPEYRTIVIKHLYDNYLGRPASAAEINAGLNILQGGESSEQLKAVLMGSQEYRTKNSGGSCADALYHALLGRAPTSAEANASKNTQGMANLPSLKFSVSEEFAHDFVIAGNTDETKHKHGSLTYLDTDGKTLVTVNFNVAGILIGLNRASENNTDKIRRVKFDLYLENISAKFAE